MSERRTVLVKELEELFQQITWRGRRHFSRRVEAVGLTVPQYLALDMIGRRGPNVAMHEVGDALQLPASTMTSIVDRLVQSGLVVRGTVPTDRRAVVATLTPEGRALVAGIEAQRHRDLAAMLGDVDDDELVTFAGLLTRMLSGIDRSLAELCLEGVPKQAAGA